MPNVLPRFNSCKVVLLSKLSISATVPSSSSSLLYRLKLVRVVFSLRASASTKISSPLRKFADHVSGGDKILPFSSTE